MEALNASNLVESDCSPKKGKDLRKDVHMNLLTCSDSMFTIHDNTLAVSKIFFRSSLRAVRELDPEHLLSSPSSSSTLSTSCSTAPVAPLSAAHVSSSILTDQLPPISEPSTSSEIPFLSTEEGSWVKSESLDHMIENLGHAFTAYEEPSNQNSFLLSTFEQDFDCGDLPLCQIPQDSYNMEDLLQLRSEDLNLRDSPSLTSRLSSSVFEDCPQVMGACASASVAPSFPLELISSDFDDGAENLSQFFAEWLKNNRNCFSAADLRRIKLKNSTIENAMQRLGGGKKGMSYLLKLILLWIQNHHLSRKRERADMDAVYSGIDDDHLNNVRCTPSPIEHEILSGPCSENQGQGNNVAVVGVMAVQGRSKADLPPETSAISASAYSTSFVPSVGSSYDAQLSLQTSDGGMFGRMATDLSADFHAFSTTQPQLCSPPADYNPSFQFSHLSPASNFPLFKETLGNNRLWHASTAQVSPGRSTVQDSNLQSFTRATPYMPVSNSLNATPSTPAAAATREARRSRMARQRWSVRRSRLWHSTGNHQLPWPSQVSGASFQNMGCNRSPASVSDVKQSRKAGRNLKLLLQKELKQSDVGNLGRIVLPKKDAEVHLPYLAARDGVNLVVEDWSSSKVWNMRYRFWPNNKSRMYLLENTGDFVKLHRMKEGDHMILYANTGTGKYVIRGIKVPDEDTSSAVTDKSSSSSCRSSSGIGRAQIAFTSPATIISKAFKPVKTGGLLEADSLRNGSSFDSSSSLSEVLNTEGWFSV